MSFSFTAACSANNKIYHHGEDIVFHNATNPIQDAACTSCKCSAGNITDCSFLYCDLGLGGWPIEVCDNWKTAQDGVCCPRCGKKKTTRQDQRKI